MNIQQYYNLKNSDLEALKSIDCLYVSPKTLFKKSDFQGLTKDECSLKAIELGWRWDISKGKYYRISGY